MIIHNFDQQSDEWFEVRLGKLTASKAQAIATNGKGLDTLCYEKVAEILTNRKPAGFTNLDIERGNKLEAMARDAYELETGNLVKQVGFVELDQYTGCSPDGLIDEDGLVELKCKNDVNFLKFALTREIETAHDWQMQMQMFVTDRKWCDYAIFNDGYAQSLIIVRVERDDAKIEKIKIGIENGIETITKLIKEMGIQNAR